MLVLEVETGSPNQNYNNPFETIDSGEDLSFYIPPTVADRPRAYSVFDDFSRMIKQLQLKYKSDIIATFPPVAPNIDM